MDTSTLYQKLPILSDETAQTLKTLKDTDIDEFYRYVKALRKEGWPLRAIAEPLGAARSVIAVWEDKAGNPSTLPKVEQLPDDLPREVKPIYIHLELTEEETKRLRALAESASQVRRFTDPSAQSRRDAAELEDLLHDYQDAGASLSVLAEACGVTRRAIAQRLEKKYK